MRGLRFEHPMLMHDFCQWLARRRAGARDQPADNMQCCALTLRGPCRAPAPAGPWTQAFLADYLTRIRDHPVRGGGS